MRQGWIQIMGLVADIGGFLLIVNEWWHAVIRERALELFHSAKRYEELAAELQRREPDRVVGRRMLDYFVVTLLEQKELAIQRAQQLENHDPVLLFRKRLRNFLTGALLVVIGFVLQTLSAIPGGIPFLGIIP